MNLFTALGNLSQGLTLQGDAPIHTGNWGTPDIGLTEIFQPYTAPAPVYTPPPAQIDSGSNNNYSLSGNNQVLSASNSQPVTQTQQPNFPSVSDEELSSIYAPAVSNLNQQQSYLEQAQPGFIQQVENQAKLSQDQLNASKTQGYQNFQNQRQELDTQKQSAISEARSLFNSLMARGQNRFGGTGSAGKYYSELIGRETVRSMGNAENTLGRGLGQITQAQNKLDSDVQLGLQEIDYRKQAGLQSIRDRFAQDIMAINSNRSMLESAKASAKIDALKTAREMAYNWNTAQEEYAQALKLYSVQQQQGLNTALASFVKELPQDAINAYSQEISNSPDYIADMGSINGSKRATYQNPFVNISGILDPNKEDDKYDLNPFA